MSFGVRSNRSNGRGVAVSRFACSKCDRSATDGTAPVVDSCEARGRETSDGDGSDDATVDAVDAVDAVASGSGDAVEDTVPDSKIRAFSRRE